MKSLYSFLLLILVISGMFLSCQADFKNSINSTQESVDREHEKLQTVLVNIPQDMIWLTLKLNYIDQYHFAYITGNKWGSSTPFFVAYSFAQDGTVKIYSTIQHDVYQTKSDKNSKIYDNPNIYQVRGDLRNELTILSKGFLSEMKQLGAVDFDYIIAHDYSLKKINIEPIYTQTTNNNFYIFPYDLKKFNLYNEVCLRLYNKSLYPGSTIEGEAVYSIKVIDNKGVETIMPISTPRNKGSYYTVLAELIHQNYEETTNELTFKIYNDWSRFNSGFSALIAALKKSDILYLKIANFIPDANGNGYPEVTFESYSKDGKGADGAKLIIAF